MSLSTKQQFLWGIIILWTPFILWGQACGCLDCPAPIPVNFNNFQLNYQVDGAVNDDLTSNNCIESVSIQFKHNRVQNLTAQLIAPSGQSVSLIGNYLPFSGSLSSTIGASWDVNFVTCSATATPDPGLAPYWDNLNPAWNVFFGNFNGSYYPPFGNCLENINTGTVNGIWQLNITNYDFPVVTGTGVIESFTINFCDETGINCCFPEGGALTDDTAITFCENEAINLPNPSTIFSEAFDTSRYYYSYLLSRDGIIVGVDSSFTLQDSVVGDYSIQGIAYTKSDSLSVANLKGTTSANLNNILESNPPPFCGELSSNAQSILILPMPEQIIRRATICEGESITLAGQVIDAAGVYDLLLTTPTACDTMLQLQVEVEVPDTTLLTRQICENESIRIAGQDFNETGQYSITLQKNNGCDSLILLDLLVQNIEANVLKNVELTCFDSEVQLDGTNSSTGAVITYTWTSEDGNILSGTNSLMPLIDAGGTYILSVQNTETGCLVRDSVFVSENKQAPQLDLPDLETLNCNQTFYQIELGASETNVSYTWRDEDMIFLTNEFEPSLLLGFYSIEAMNTENGCSAIASIQIEHFPSPIISISSENIAEECLVLQVQLEAETTNDLLQYTWLDANNTSISTTRNIEIETAGTYYLEAFDAQTRCSALDSIRIEATNGTAIENVGFDIQQLDCIEHPLGSIEVNRVQGGQAPFLYALDELVFSTNNRFPALEANTYQVRIQDAQGCQWDTLLVIENLPELEVELGDIRRIGLGEHLTLEAIPNRAINSIQWSSSSTDSLDCPTCLSQTIQPLQNTSYSVEVLDENGCMATDVVRIVLLRDVPIYIPTAFSPNDDGENDFFELYPRTSAVKAIEEVQIFNRWGELVFEQADGSNAIWDGRYKGQLLPAEVYVVSANVEYIDGRKEVLRGEVTLVR